MKNLISSINIETLKEDWKLQYTIIFIILCFFATAMGHFGKPLNVPHPPVEQVFLDKLLPPGHRMAPLEAQNISSLEKIMGNTAVVTLFNSETDEIVASGIKVLRAPQSPETIMYVSPIEASRKISMLGNKLIAVLQNPKSSIGADFVREKPEKPRRLIILN